MDPLEPATRRPASPAPRDADLPTGPLELTPVPVGRPWGGGRFGAVGGDPVGEMWVTADDATLPDGRTLAATGLAPLVPLVKLLDIKGRLSVQVHPDDQAAVELRGLGAVGKHECWVVLAAPAGAAVSLGLVPGASVDDLFSGDAGRIVGALRKQPIAAGTILDIPPGTVHAPGGGLLLYEVQQRSDLTFRIWDWGRPRPLHLVEARRSIRPGAAPRVGTLPTGIGSALVSASTAPFRLVSCHLAGHGGPAGIECDAPGILSITGGTLELAGADPVDPGSAGPISVAGGSHWLLPPGRWSLSGSGDALLAWNRRSATSP